MTIRVMNFNMIEYYASELDDFVDRGTEYDPSGEDDAMITASDKVLDFFKSADDDKEAEKVMKADEDYLNAFKVGGFYGKN